MSDIKLLYWIRGRPFHHWIPILISLETSVHELINRITESDAPFNLVPEFLDVFKVPDSTPLRDDDSSSIDDVLGAFTISQLGKPLRRHRTVASYFKSGVPKDQLNLVIDMLHIFCWPRGGRRSNVVVDAPIYAKPSELRQMILQAYNMPFTPVTLYKVPCTENDIFRVLDASGTGQLLDQEHDLQTVFNDVRFSCNLNIVVEGLDQGIGRNLPVPITEARLLPHISSLANPHSPDSPIEFEIYERILYDKTTERELYLAKTSDNQVILVKFSRRYSLELHSFCARHGCAPALLGFERLPGGFFGIAMEFVESAIPITQSPHVEKHTEWVTKLRALVQSFHDVDLVHGDLRSPNIICDGSRIMLIDFDWGGKLGDAVYPDILLHPDLTDGRRSSDKKITKEDDLRVLERTLRAVPRLTP